VSLPWMEAVLARRRWISTLLSSQERHDDDWLQTEAREIQIRIEGQYFKVSVIIHEDKLPRKAGVCGGLGSSPATSLKEMS